MMLNYRTYTTLIAAGLFDWLVKLGVIDLTNPLITKETLEGIVLTLMLILAGLFKKYAGRRLFTKKPQPIAEGGVK